MIKSAYPEIPLPEHLENPRTIFFDDQVVNPSDFYLKLFRQLRTDVAALHEHSLDVIAMDTGPPSISDLTFGEKIRYYTAQRCELCHARFGAKIKRAQGLRPCRVTRVIDHAHVPYTESERGRLRYVSCQACNVNLSQSVVSTKANIVCYLHNGSR